jgi:hypothetical protein
MPKPDRYFRETFSQTSPSAIQIKAPQFDELQITLQTSLRSGGYLKTQIPVLSAKLLELFEESRAQMADENIKVWKPLEVTNQLVCDLYNANRTDARLEKNGDVYGSRGFMYPFWTRVANDTKQLIFIGQGFSTSVDTPLATVEAFCNNVNEKFSHQKYTKLFSTFIGHFSIMSFIKLMLVLTPITSSSTINNLFLFNTESNVEIDGSF